MMAPKKTPWHTDRWFTSPWNYLDEVMQGSQFPKRVKFHDAVSYTHLTLPTKRIV